MALVDIASTPRTTTISSYSSTNTYLRSVLNAASTYRGTSNYYSQRVVANLLAEALTELGFSVTKNNSTNYYNHLVLDDFSEDVCLQFWANSATSGSISFIYPRHTSPTLSVGSTFHNNGNAFATLRMIGQGAGKTKTALLLSGSAVPELNRTYVIYFTEAKFLMTGETKKAVVIQNGYNYYFYIYDENWKFLPGFISDSVTVISMDSYWYNLSYNYNYCYVHDPYTSYKMFVEQTEFPEVPIVTNDGMWEFPDIIQQPFGYIEDSGGKLKYALTNGTIYQIGDKKYLCSYAGNSYYLLRVE